MTRLEACASRGSKSHTMKRYPPISSARRLFFAAGLSVAAAVVAAQPVAAKAESRQSGTEFGLPMTLSGSYLSGRLAGQNNDLENAAAFFGEALE